MAGFESSKFDAHLKANKWNQETKALHETPYVARRGSSRRVA